VIAAEASAVAARAELHAWYVGRLRPKLEDAVSAGSVEPGAVEALDFQLSDFFEPEEVPQEVV